VVRSQAIEGCCERHSSERMKQRADANKPSSLHVDFLGLTVEISERVLRAWGEVTEEQRFRYLERTYEAQRNAREVKRHSQHPDDEQDEDELAIVHVLIGSEWKYHRLGIIRPDEVALISAYRKGDSQTVRRMAERMRKGEATPKRRDQIKDVLLAHWISPQSAGLPLEPDDICLIWFSTGAIEELLRKGGFWEVKKTVKALEARITRLRLPKLPEPIAHLKHLQWKEKHLIVS
jgi:hypothetical protein